MARPTKLTPQLQELLCNALRIGNYYEAACGYVGIPYRTFRKWMIRGQKDKAGRFGQFRQAVLKALADTEVTIVQEWRKKCPEDYRACRDFLGRRFPKRWGPKEQHEVTGKGGGELVVKLIGAGVSMDDL